MTFPRYFSSEKEYAGYCSCKQKLRLNDEVFIYADGDGINGQRIHQASRKTAFIHVKPFAVIAIKKRNTNTSDFCIGSKEPFGTFWSSLQSSLLDYSGMQLVKNIKEFNYAYWLYDTDIRIAKIVRK